MALTLPRRPRQQFLSMFVSLALAFGTSCSYARTPFLLKTLNEGIGSGEPPPRPSPSKRVADLAQTHLVDSYFDPTTVGTWLADVGANSGPIAKQLDCLRESHEDSSSCYESFPADASTAWKLPAFALGSAATLPVPSSPEYAKEVDAQRFLANSRWIASSLQVLDGALGRPLTTAEVSEGIRDAATRARAYLAARSWHRSPQRPTTALVMSGGGATGAFTAGFVFRLLDVLENCHAAAGDACPDAKIDLVVGTSTGALVGALVDLAHVASQRARAKRLLVDNYTCSTEKTLYCKHDEWDWKLAEDLRGLMKFRGIEQKLLESLTPEVQTNGTEFVTLSVDYDSGYLFAQSDQDPTDRATGVDRVQTVLASIVEPILSDPVDYVMIDGKRVNGTFIDGGVRSGLPLLQAVRRGAERVIVISTSSIDIGPSGHAKSAIPILMRTIDLATSQNLAAEFQQAEFEAAARRLAEFELCDTRLQDGGVGVIERRDFCRRTALWPPRAQAQASVSNYIGPGLFQNVAKTWSSEWVVRPENGAPGATGYTFDPKAMRLLFKDGVRTFQQRCQETLRLLNVSPEVRNLGYACSMTEEAALALAERTFKPISECDAENREIPECE
jgi:predicted acylesterase/phospholipase RssA